MKECMKAYWDKLAPEKDKKIVAANRRKNWLFVFSAVAFFCLNITMTTGYIISIPIAVILAAVVAGRTPNLWKKAHDGNVLLWSISLLSALGTCWGAGAAFYYAWKRTAAAQQLEVALGLNADIAIYFSIIGAVCSLVFVFYYMLLFWEAMISDLQEVFREVKAKEWMVYFFLALVVVCAMAVIFGETDAFYGTIHTNDVIYTSDSPALVKDNVYLSLAHQECDFRQPLFAVFAAPFLGIPYLVGRLAGSSATVEAIALNGGQIMMLLAANFMLSKLLKLSPGKRICFMILSCSMYGTLLFTLMMEQYIIAYFWLIFSMYQICERGKLNRLGLWGAGGTLVISVILLPAMSQKHPLKQFKEWFAEMVLHGVEFLVLLLTFSRFEVFYNLVASMNYLMQFTGKEVDAMNKLHQFTEFVKNCFAIPNAGVDVTLNTYASWQLMPVTAPNWVGIGILILCVCSAVWNRKNISSRMAAIWAAFSVVMLLVLGWGTAENGLILYSLYFGWAFLVLLFQLVEKIEETLHIRHLTCICGVLAAAAMLAVNIPAIFEMINFAIAYYPV